MPTARNLRIAIEEALADRVPAALTLAPKAARQGVSSGISEVDEALPSGLPCGVITELVGAECSGRTSLALAYVAAVVGSGNVCAWVDVADALCPESVAANGVDLERLLWVRCGSLQPKPSRAALALGGSTARPEIEKEAGASPKPRHTGGGEPASSFRRPGTCRRLSLRCFNRMAVCTIGRFGGRDDPSAPRGRRTGR